MDDAQHHPARLPPHLLQQSGQGGDEPEDAAVPDGPQRYRRDDERVHASGAGGCGSGDGQDGSGRGGQERTGQDLGRNKTGKCGITENVQSGMKKQIGAHHLRVVGFFCFCGKLRPSMI